MNDDIFEKLAEALGRLPNGFPRTSSKVEILVLRKIFSHEEADIASRLSGDLETVDAIAGRLGISPSEAIQRLRSMASRGLLWFHEEEEKIFYRLAPFVVGIYEAQLENMDHELAHLVEDYLAQGGGEGIMKPRPAIHRVLPAQKAVKTEWVLPYDDVKRIISESKTFNVRDCICRVQRDFMGHKCRFPTKMCLGFSPHERPPAPDDMTREEALALLDEAEKIGLVHTVSNVASGHFYVCNCCGCCCGILRGMTEWGIENSVAHANCYAIIDAEECMGCGTCEKRCQVRAISTKNDVAVVNKNKCIGCGLCVTGCPNDVAKLLRKEEAEIIHPPKTFEAWEKKRLENRRLMK